MWSDECPTPRPAKHHRMIHSLGTATTCSFSSQHPPHHCLQSHWGIVLTLESQRNVGGWRRFTPRNYCPTRTHIYIYIYIYCLHVGERLIELSNQTPKQLISSPTGPNPAASNVTGHSVPRSWCNHRHDEHSKKHLKGLACSMFTLLLRSCVTPELGTSFSARLHLMWPNQDRNLQHPRGTENKQFKYLQSMWKRAHQMCNQCTIYTYMSNIFVLWRPHISYECILH